MLGNEEKYISFEKWTEMMARQTFIFEEEKNRHFDKLFEMYGDEFDEDDSESEKHKKEEKRRIYF